MPPTHARTSNHTAAMSVSEEATSAFLAVAAIPT
jgi:hypothetical protein